MQKLKFNIGIPFYFQVLDEKKDGQRPCHESEEESAEIKIIG